MAVTGSGTQQDPYIFNSFLELIEMQMEEVSNTNYYEYGGSAREEDMNPIFSEGLENTIVLKGYIDFKGLIISNLRSRATYVITLSGNLSNVTFKNLIWNFNAGIVSLIYGTTVCNLYNVKIYCNIDATLSDSSSKEFHIIYFSSTNSESGNVDKSVIRLKGTITSGTTSGNANNISLVRSYGLMQDCNIIFDDFSLESPRLFIKSPTSTTPIGLKMLSCSINGKINVATLGDTSNNSSTNHTNMLNIFNVECEGVFTHNSNGLTLFNSTKAPNFVESVSTNFIGVTDEQMKDPFYLQSIGFPCYGGE